MAERHGRLPAQIALAWVLRQPGVVAIPKSADPAHLRHNAGAAEIVLEEAGAQAEQQADAPVIITAGGGWHPGVIGIVAGLLRERLGRPAIVIARGADGWGKGSGRSMAGVDLGAAVLAAKDSGLLVAGGLFAFYWFDGQWPTFVRVLSVLVGLIAAGAVFMTTAKGAQTREFFAETRFELRKVVWPTRQEAMRMTWVVIIAVIIIALVLAGFDTVIQWLLRLFLGH